MEPARRPDPVGPGRSPVGVTQGRRLIPGALALSIPRSSRAPFSPPRTQSTEARVARAARLGAPAAVGSRRASYQRNISSMASHAAKELTMSDKRAGPHPLAVNNPGEHSE